MKNLVILDSEKREIPSSENLLARFYEYIEEKYLRVNYNYFIIPKLKRCMAKGNTKIVCLDKEMEELLIKNKIEFTPFNDYVEEKEYEKYTEKAREFIKNLPDIVPEIGIKYKGLSLWEINYLILYESFLSQLMCNVQIIDKIIDVERPKNLIIFNSLSMGGIIQREFGARTAIIDKTGVLSKVNKIIIRILTPFALKMIYSSFMTDIKNARYAPRATGKVIFFDKERALRLCYPFLKKIKEDATILQYEEHKNKAEFCFDSLKNYINKDSKKELILFRNRLIKRLKDMKKSRNLRKRLRYKDLGLFNSLEDMLNYLFIIGYLKDAFTYESLNNFFIEKKPKLIIHMGEEPKEHKIILDLSKRYGAKTLFIMHGAFGMSYFLDNLLSDKILVYGQHYKDLLIKMRNKGSRIIVVGNPYWDYLAKEKFDRNKIISELNIKNNKKIILLASVHTPVDAKKRLAHATIKAMKELKDFHLIIKLHPEEGPDFYNKLLEEYGVNATIIEDLSLLHQLIYIAELVVVYGSAVGLESLILDKPLIDVSLPKEPFYQDYMKEGVALGVRKEDEMLTAIRSILENREIREELKKNRKKYVYSHAYKQDGKASERILKVIKLMIK